MWKFIFYSNLLYEKVEKKLSDYEKEGFRLEAVKFKYFFKFKQSDRKDSEYICAYFLPKESFADFDYRLKRDHNATQIKTDFFTNIDVYRIVSKTQETKPIKNEIKKYFLHCSFHKILLALFFLLISASGICIACLQGLDATYDKIAVVFLSIISTLSIVSVVKNLFVIRHLGRKS